jgi:lysozyme
MKLNKAGLDLIKSFEGLKLKPYLCPAGIPTIGYGSTVYEDGRKVSLKDLEITEEKASELLEAHVKKDIPSVSKLILVPLNDNEFSAIVSFVYNVGVNAFAKSTMLKLINAKADKLAIADQLLRWNKAGGKELPGLTRRRQAEKALFLHPMPIDKPSLLPDTPSEDEINVELKDIEDSIIKKP